MSVKSKGSLLIQLFKDKDIINSTINWLRKYGFDTNDALLALDFDTDLPQMVDICLSQRSRLKQVLTKYRQQYLRGLAYIRCNSLSSDESVTPMTIDEGNCHNNNDGLIDNFSRRESIVKTFKRELREENSGQQHQEMDANNRYDNDSDSDMNIDGIVDQLKESLIRVEKQKQEKDFVLNRKCLEIKVKDMEIKRLELELKQMERQLICEKRVNKKLRHHMKTSGHLKECLQTDQSLDNELKDIYCNSNTTEDSEECDQLSSGADDSNISSSCSSDPKFVNSFCTQVQLNSTEKPNNSSFKGCNSSSLTAIMSSNRADTSSTPDATEHHRTVSIDLGYNEISVLTESDRKVNINIIDSDVDYDSDGQVVNVNENTTNDTKGSDIDDNCPLVESIVCEPDFQCLKQTDVNLNNNRNCDANTDNPVTDIKDVTTRSKIRRNNSSQKPKDKSYTQKSGKGSQKRSHRCQIGDCNYRFVSKCGLKRHIRSMHMNERPYECEFEDCGKRFSRSDSLREHMKRHLGLKHNKCDYSDCEFESVSSNSLKRHVMAIHLKVRQFRCVYRNCGKTFSRKDGLTKHTERYH